MACGAAGSPDRRPAEAIPSADAAAEWFTDQAEASGLDFVHFNGMSGRFYQPEIMAPGAALFDYDNDGDLDVYLVQGRMLGAGHAAARRRRQQLEDRLYRNDLVIQPTDARRCGSPT